MNNFKKRKKLISNGWHLPYRPNNVEYARKLRREMTKTEKILWYEFLYPHPVKFLRQRPINHYIVDFYCAKAKLVIELDGAGHFTEDGKRYDQLRTEILESYGLRVLRFTNDQVLHDLEGVCAEIDEILTPLLLPPLRKGGGLGE